MAKTKDRSTAMAAMFMDCAKQVLKGGIKTKGQAGLVAFFLDCAQKSISK